MKRIVLLLSMIVSLFAFSAGNARAVVMVNFDPATGYADVGSTFNVNITADIIADQALVGWGFNLLYDQTQVLLNTVSTSPLWDLIPSADKSDLSALLLPDLTSPDPGLWGTNVLLATLNFSCLGPGSSTLDITVPQDPTKGFMTWDGNNAPWESSPGLIEQGNAPIPEPSTALLLGVGLGGVAWFSRKVRKG